MELSRKPLLLPLSKSSHRDHYPGDHGCHKNERRESGQLDFWRPWGQDRSLGASHNPSSHTSPQRAPFPQIKDVHLHPGPKLTSMRPHHICGLIYIQLVGLAWKINLGHSEGCDYLFARKPAGNLLSSSPPPLLPTEHGVPCRSQLNLAWQRARVTGGRG